MNKRLTFRLLIGMAAIVSILYGMQREEGSIIFHKAVNICLECIGIG